jgi:hypothetical protein
MLYVSSRTLLKYSGWEKTMIKLHWLGSGTTREIDNHKSRGKEQVVG